MKRTFEVVYNPQIYLDIQKTVDYYLRETGNDELGKRFVESVETALKTLSRSDQPCITRLDMTTSDFCRSRLSHLWPITG